MEKLLLLLLLVCLSDSGQDLKNERFLNATPSVPATINRNMVATDHRQPFDVDAAPATVAALPLKLRRRPTGLPLYELSQITEEDLDMKCASDVDVVGIKNDATVSFFSRTDSGLRPYSWAADNEKVNVHCCCYGGALEREPLSRRIGLNGNGEMESRGNAKISHIVMLLKGLILGVDNDVVVYVVAVDGLAHDTNDGSYQSIEL